MSGFPDPINISGAGSGTNTAGGLDNDLLCKDAFKHNLAENFGDGVAVGKCTIVQDAGGNGTVDIEDNASNEDRDTDAFLREDSSTGAGNCTGGADNDGDTLVDMADPGCNYSDASEAAVGSNPLNPTDKPCVAGKKVVLWRTAGPLVSALADTDNDLLLDQCETPEGTTAPSQDTDGDGIFDGIEVGLSVNPLVSSGAHAVGGADSDGDGCTNAQEKGDDPNVGGLRHPGNYWDNPTSPETAASTPWTSWRSSRTSGTARPTTPWTTSSTGRRCRRLTRLWAARRRSWWKETTESTLSTRSPCWRCSARPAASRRGTAGHADGDDSVRRLRTTGLPRLAPGQPR